MFTAIIAISGLAACFGLLLGFAAVRFRSEGDPVVERIDALLPQAPGAARTRRPATDNNHIRATHGPKY